MLTLILQGMVPESHEIAMSTTDELSQYFTTAEFRREVIDKLKSNYEVDLHVNGLSSAAAADRVESTKSEVITLSYTRNNAGGLKDAIDFLTTQLVAHGLDASTVSGAIPRPKSDSFEDSLPFFDSKLLHRAEPSTDSPARSIFNEDVSERSFFDKLRKPGSISSLSSFLDRRKNSSNSSAAFMKHASSNASKASLASIESQNSYRNPWNDSGVNLPDEDQQNGWPARFSRNGSTTLLSVHTEASASSLSLTSTPLPPLGSSGANNNPISSPGDVTPTHGSHPSRDSGRPSTAHSTASGHGHGHGHGPIGPPFSAK